MKRIALILLATAIALMVGGCCYRQSYGPSFEEEAQAMKGKAWFFGFKSATKPLISAPLLLNDKLYITSLGGFLYCADKDKGHLIDTFKFNEGRPLKGGFRSGPITDGRNLFIGNYDHNLYAIEPGSGMVQWVYPASGKIEGAPALMDGKIYFGTWTDKLYCNDKRDGTPIWEFETKDKVRCSPVAFNGAVYFGDMVGNFYCISVTGPDPELKWEFKAGDEIYGEPATDGVLVWFTSLDGNIYCLDAATGAQKWVFTTEGPIWAGPCIDTFTINTASQPVVDTVIGDVAGSGTVVTAGGAVVQTSPEGTMVVPGDASGEETVPPDDMVENPPVNMEAGKTVTRLYVGSMDAKFYILDAITGEPAVYFDDELGEDVTIKPYSRADAVANDHGIQGTAVTDDKNVYFGAGDFFFRALDKTTGKLVWEFETRGEIRSKPIVYEGKVVFGCDDAYLYGLKTDNGKPVRGTEE